MAEITEEDMEYICDHICRWPYECTEEELEEQCKECRIAKKSEEKQ